MNQKLLLSGFVILFPKPIIFLILSRLVFRIKAIKYSLLCIAVLFVFSVMLAFISIGLLLECCSNRFKERRMVIKMLCCSLAFFAVLWAVRYSIFNIRKRVDKLLTNWTFSSTVIRGAVYNNLA